MAQTRKDFGRATILGLALMGVIGALILISITAVFYLGRSSKADAAPGTVVTSSGPTIMQLQSLGELVVLRVSVADVLEGKGEGYRGSWLIKGDALISIDLRQSRFQSADHENKKLIVILPPPKVIQPRVDHDRTRTWEVKKMTWIPFGGNPDKLRDTVMQEAQNLVNFACNKGEIDDQARSNTILLLTHMYRFIGWDAEIVWEDGYENTPGND